MAQENPVANDINTTTQTTTAAQPIAPTVAASTQQQPTPRPVTQGGTPTRVVATAPGVRSPAAQAAPPRATGSVPVSPGPVIQRPSFVIKSAKASYQYLNLLIYGDFGVGKTSLAASAQDVLTMQDTIFIDVESGGRVIDDREDIDTVGINAFQQFARVYEFLRMHCKARDANDIDQMIKLESYFKTRDPKQPYIVTEPKRYKTVIVDSLTEVQKYCMYQLLGVKVGEFALDMEPENPQYSEWGKSTEMIRLLVRSFRNLDMNTIFVCSRLEDQDERKRFFYAPALPGKLSNEVQGFFDAVGYYYSGVAIDGGQVNRRLYLSPGQTFKAKNRFSKWNGTYLDNPTMSDIYKLSQL